jgi:hypothetical protein
MQRRTFTALAALNAMSLAGGLPVHAQPVHAQPVHAQPAQTQPAHAQAAFPGKPITIVVPASPGGAIDLAARLIGQKMTESWGQPVLIDNKTGATGIIGTDLVAKSPPDGHMLALVASSHAINPSMVKKLPFDTVKSFEPVALTHVVPLVLIVSPTAAGQVGEGADRLRQGQPRQAHLRIQRQRRRAAFLGRAVQVASRASR